MEPADRLDNKRILFGVTGGIAAYKSCLVIRELLNLGAEVRVVMTPSALNFITPLTLASLSNNEVILNTFPESGGGSSLKKTWHIDLAAWADLMIIAPATVNSVAKITHGFADNALTTLVTALRCPLLICPSADTDMYENEVNSENLRKLEKRGTYILHAEEGALASGLYGIGRLPETDKIVDSVKLLLSGYNKDLKGKNILVTAGPTYEDIDPVRFIGNRSSGKTGFNIANAAYLRGANVTLVTGPANERCYPEIKSRSVRSAEEMGNEIDELIKENEVLIMSAAVSDFRPGNPSIRKIRKENGAAPVELIKNRDILSTIEKGNKILVGFALETENSLENAEKKLKNKNLDLIVLNTVTDSNPAFESETNRVTIISREGGGKELPLLSKFEIANKILDEVKNLLN